jgi:hypothetical protein
MPETPVTGVLSVLGKTTVTIPELAGLVEEVAPVT